MFVIVGSLPLAWAVLMNGMIAAGAAQQFRATMQSVPARNRAAGIGLALKNLAVPGEVLHVEKIGELEVLLTLPELTWVQSQDVQMWESLERFIDRLRAASSSDDPRAAFFGPESDSAAINEP